jgi:hypothetical protein
MVWQANTATSKEQRLTLRHFSRRIPSRKIGLTEQQCKFLVFLLPTAHYGNGTGTVDATAKTLTDASAGWYKDEKAGWWVVLEYEFADETETQLFYAGAETQALFDSEWTNYQTGGTGTITRTAPGLNSTAGCIKATVAGGDSARVRYASVNLITERSYVLSFWFDISNPVIADGDNFRLGDMQVTDGATNFFNISIRRSGANYQFRCRIYNDDNTSVYSTWTTFTKANEQFMEIIFKRPTTATSSDGELRLYHNNAHLETISGRDFYDKFPLVSDLRLGVVTNAPAGTSGDVLVDEVYIRQGRDVVTGSEVFYAGNEADLAEWDTITDLGAGSIVHNTPGLDGTAGKILVTLPGAEGAAIAYRVEKSITVKQTAYAVSYYQNISGLVGNMADTDVFINMRTLETVGFAGRLFTEIQYTIANGYRLRAAFRADGGAFSYSAYATLSQTADNLITVIWKKSSTVATADSIGYLYMDGTLIGSVTAFISFTVFHDIQRLDVGVTSGLDVGTSGTYEVDEVYLVEGDQMLLDATNKFGVVPSKIWTADEWIGYWIWINNHPYYVLDNDVVSMDLSDSFSYLVSGTYEWDMTKWFKIFKNTETVATLEDPDDELIDDTSDYWIDFVEMKITKSNFDYSQNVYRYDRDTTKGSYRVDWEEI